MDNDRECERCEESFSWGLILSFLVRPGPGPANLFRMIHFAGIQMFFFICWLTEPIIQQFLLHFLTFCRTSFASCDFQISSKDRSLRFPMLVSMTLHGNISPWGSRKKESCPISQGNNLGFPLDIIDQSVIKVGPEPVFHFARFQ